MLVRSVSYKRIKGITALILISNLLITTSTTNTATIIVAATTTIVITTTTASIDLAVKGLIVYNRVIEKGLLEEARKQYPIVRQPRKPIRRGSSKAAKP
ncbi:hypothetical protein P8C59_006415 [Phyllachora maydis]|uniref:Uncharacterized protein n=1 Tax=Phyllachora maydis TaxID=1825666 RepID=A0AAD9I6G6_9PEZI|nr:hypothetical protein P8C59_006415 [Phyllachora maydis]